MPDVKWYSASTASTTGVAVAAGSGTTNRLMKFDAADAAADSLLSDDATNVQLTSGQYLLSTDTGIRRDAAGSLSFTNGSTGHATGFGLGTATPKVITSSFTTPATTLQVKDTSTNAFVVISGVTTAYLGLIDSDAAAGYKMVFLEHGADLIRLARFDDAANLAATYLSIVPSTNVVTLGSASVTGLVLNPGTGEISTTAGASFNIGNAATAPASNYLVIGGVSGAGGTPTTTHVTAGSGVAIYVQEAHDAQATKFVIAYNNYNGINYLVGTLDGATATWTNSTTRP